MVETPSGWERDGEVISRVFTLGDFNAAMGFVNRVAMASEVADHHPDIDIRWNKVTLVLTTHSEGRLTDKDVHLAETINSFV